MGAIWVKEFVGGLDTRRMPETTRGGSVIRAVDGHINRGGEFEQRAAFVPVHTLPTGTTKSLTSGKRALCVFGHDPALGIPTGITYQRLQHPDGITALVNVVSADLYAGLIYAVGVFADGSQHHFYNGTRVADWVDGRSRRQFQLGGSATGILTGLTVDGVDIIGTTIAWSGSNEETAAAIAAAINSFGSEPEYVATVFDDYFCILAAIPGTAANTKAVVFTVTGDLVITPSPSTLTGGAAVAANDFQSGLFAKTVGSKMYALSGPNLHFSGVADPIHWDTGTTGAGFTDMSSETSGAEELMALAKYQQYLAIFSGRVIQIWYVDPDPDLNRSVQDLVNTGTLSPRSVTQFGDNDVFYLDENGLRSLRARDSSNAAATSDIGIPVDKPITDKLKAMTTFERSRIIGLIEPSDGRFWLIFPDEIFVFSFFPGSKISAWSTYLPTAEVDGVQTAFEIDDAAVFKGRVYLRSGDTVYGYGGVAATPEFDNTAPELWLPYLDGDAPTVKKHVTGFDAACEGEWEVRIGMDSTDLTASERIGILTGTTFNKYKIPAGGAATHISIRLVGRGSSAKKISSCVLHYVADDEED